MKQNIHLLFTTIVVVIGLRSLIKNVNAGSLPDPFLLKRDAIEAQCGIGNFGGVFSILTLDLTTTVTTTTTVWEDIYVDCATDSVDGICMQATAVITDVEMTAYVTDDPDVTPAPADDYGDAPPAPTPTDMSYGYKYRRY